MRPLAERLRQLGGGTGPVPEPPAAPAAGPPAERPALSALEQRLLGTVEDGLTLKERLERLVSAAAARTPRRPAAVPLEELSRGDRVENARGECWRVEHATALDDFRAGLPLSRVRTLSPEAVRILAGDEGLADFDLRRALFLDTETTGLSGGAGTAAFLVGLGWFEDERFVVRQYLMRDYHEEAALLFEVARESGRFEHLVTFNGRSYDVPLLETRYRLNREPFPLGRALHLDLLHPARRLWKLRLESCRLQVLEAQLLDVRRVEDVPGDQIPQVWFDYLRSRDARALARVLEHNRLDVLSLAAVSVLAGQWVEEPWCDDPRDIVSLGRVLERAALHDRGAEQYRRVADSSAPAALRAEAMRRLATRARRAGDHEEAAAMWERAAACGDVAALRALAVHAEHRRRDPAAALGLVDRALACGGGLTAALRDDLRRRRDRLERKLARAREAERTA